MNHWSALCPGTLRAMLMQHTLRDRRRRLLAGVSVLMTFWSGMAQVPQGAAARADAVASRPTEEDVATASRFATITSPRKE